MYWVRGFLVPVGVRPRGEGVPVQRGVRPMEGGVQVQGGVGPREWVVQVQGRVITQSLIPLGTHSKDTICALFWPENPSN